MSDNEKELLHLIREHNPPEEGLMIALDIISKYLSLHGSCPSKDFVDLQELA